MCSFAVLHVFDSRDTTKLSSLNYEKSKNLEPKKYQRCVIQQSNTNFIIYMLEDKLQRTLSTIIEKSRTDEKYFSHFFKIRL